MGDGSVSRRQLLAAGAALGSAALGETVSPAAARTIQGELPWAPGEADAPEPVQPGGYTFFSPDEAAFVEAATARLIPSDDLGPGAREAGCAFFIDHQLAGAYGRAERWYMQGPWAKGEETQGYQSRLTPAQLYRAAIKAIDDHCRQAFGGKRFADLGADDQDKLLGDPLYGGNRDMVGWKLIGFPGARYDYRDFVGKHGQKYPLPPVGIMGRPDWTPAKS